MAGTLEGQLALVTGGGRGQGRSHALALAAEGADVVVCDIAADIATVPYAMSRPADLDETVRQVQALGRRAVGVVADMRHTDQVQGVVDVALSTFGRIDILAANHGVISYSPVDSLTDEAWDDIIATNLTGIFKITRAVLPQMRKQGHGRVVATSSHIGRSGRANVAAYASSKWAIIGFVKSCAQDVAGTGITVNAVAPTSVETDMIYNLATRKLFCPDLENPTKQDMEARMADAFGPAHFPAEEVSRALMFLVTDLRGVYTGQVIDIGFGALTRMPV
jgi:NAD(P)-dependent dehydrogenase (short-subunit alcohol dehydrogenase family)